MTDFSVYLTSIGNDTYQMFAKNNLSDADFIRVIVGYTEIHKGKRSAQVMNSWIISPLKSSDEPIFIQQTNKYIMRNKRLWVAFEAVVRSKPKNKTICSFVALSPSQSKLRKKIGSSTYFGIKLINSIKSLEIPNQIAES